MTLIKMAIIVKTASCASHYIEPRYAECYKAKCRYSKYSNAEFHIVEWYFANYLYVFCRKAKWCLLSIILTVFMQDLVMLRDVMVSVIMLNVVKLIVGMLSIVRLIVAGCHSSDNCLLNVVMLSNVVPTLVMLNVIKLSVGLLSIIMLIVAGGYSYAEYSHA
jgi:hypothetical protein